MKKILILGGASVHCKLVTAAKEMGIYTIVTDYLTDSPAKKIADKSFMYDINDIDGIVEMCKREKVDGVIGPYLDPCQRPYFLICHRLGLPCFIQNWEQVFTLTDKTAFKDFCKKNGVDVIPTFDLENPDKIEYPVLVKPSLSRGSRGQKVCNTLDEVLAAAETAKRESGNSDYIIEKFMGTKNDFTMNLLFVDGFVYVTKTSDIYTGSLADDLENVHIAVVSPSRFTDLYFEKVHSRVVQMLKSLGIVNGPVFMQGFVDGDTIRFYDPGFRFPGSGYDLMLKDSCHTDIMKLLIEYALTGSFRNRYLDLREDTAAMGGRIAVTLTPVLRPGKIAAIEGADAVSSLPGMVSVSLRHTVGEEISFSKSVSQTAGAFEFLSENFSGMKKTFRKVLETLHVKDGNGEEMLYGNDIEDTFVAADCGAEK